MKKIIALVLSLVFILSASVNAFALSTLPPGYFDDTKSEIKPVFSEYFKQNTGGKEIYDIEILGRCPDYVVFRFTSNADENKEYFNRFGIYFEHTRTTRPLFPSGYVMYDNKSNEFLSLQDASEKRLLNLDAYCIDTYFTDIEFSIVGAVGWPAGILDIVSVTYLQMDLAKETSEYDVRTVDFNNDGKYNIKDATDIQKYLVGAEI